MKTNKKLLPIALATLLSLNVIAMPVLAAEIPAQPTDLVVTPQAEETEWAYRVHDGVLQKRLWSNTYAKWLTDWIDC